LQALQAPQALRHHDDTPTPTPTHQHPLAPTRAHSRPPILGLPKTAPGALFHVERWARPLLVAPRPIPYPRLRPPASFWSVRLHPGTAACVAIVVMLPCCCFFILLLHIFWSGPPLAPSTRAARATSIQPSHSCPSPVHVLSKTCLRTCRETKLKHAPSAALGPALAATHAILDDTAALHLHHCHHCHRCHHCITCIIFIHYLHRSTTCFSPSLALGT
jgi:hypothetical protein